MARHAALLAAAAGFGTASIEPTFALDLDGASMARVVDLIGAELARLVALAKQGLERQPSIAVAVLAASAVPVVALLAGVSRMIAAIAARRATDETADGPHTSGRRSSTAWIEVEKGPASPIRVGELVRIGCGAECELALEGVGLAETHALIQRTPELEFYIFDVSDSADGGVAVNGERSWRHRLRNGDRIEIGDARVVFRSDVTPA